MRHKIDLLLDFALRTSKFNLNATPMNTQQRDLKILLDKNNRLNKLNINNL